VLLKADANGSNWTDERIAEAFSCHVQTIEQIRQRLVERGFRETLDGASRKDPPTQKLLTREQEAKIIAMRLGPAPKGYANWTLRCKHPRLPVLLGLVACKADQSVPFQEATRWQEPRTQSAMPSGAVAFAAKRPAV
jgi:hypothetical protein